jgi:ArsR family transcriptional regulator, arsenate/arsenite/antimonite-responsive transcriptional repressor
MPEKTEYQQQAKIFTALSDPTRLQIVELLAGCDELATAAIADKLEISLSLACHHAKILAEAGLIEKRKEGQTSYSRLTRSSLLKTLEHLTRLTDRSHADR